jgi:ectoine hydroxylase-related dioxygenase (phytanoyl-CoA dioxygenase family)
VPLVNDRSTAPVGAATAAGTPVGHDPFAGDEITRSARRLTTDEQRATVAGPLAQLREQGWAVLPGLLSPQERGEVAAELERLHEPVATGTNAFAGFTTRRLFNLLARTRRFDPLVAHPAVLALVEGLLDDQVQLSIVSSIDLGPGGEAQPLHRDDGYYPLPRPHPALSVNVMWAIDDFTEANGATRYVPGSHLWEEDRRPGPAEVRSAEMPAGSVFVWHGSLLHGGGRNASASRRCGLSALYCRAWLRQQENQYLGLAPEVVAGFDRPFQRLLGYAMYGATLGNVDGADPRHWLERHRVPAASAAGNG